MVKISHNKAMVLREAMFALPRSIIAHWTYWPRQHWNRYMYENLKKIIWNWLAYNKRWWEATQNAGNNTFQTVNFEIFQDVLRWHWCMYMGNVHVLWQWWLAFYRLLKPAVSAAIAKSQQAVAIHMYKQQQLNDDFSWRGGGGSNLNWMGDGQLQCYVL